MPSLTIYDLPPELLYTILSHALADVLFDYLFVGALVLPNNTHPKAAASVSMQVNPGLEEISSLGQVSVAWRVTLERTLGAVLNPISSLYHSSNQARLGVQSPKQQQLYQQRRVRQLTTASHHASSSSPATSTHHSISGSPNTVIIQFINPDVDHTATRETTITTCLQQYRSTLRAMQGALRDLVQHSIDTYRAEQDAMAAASSQAHQATGVTTPPLVPSTPPLPPHSIPPLQGAAPQHVVLPPAIIGGGGGGHQPTFHGPQGTLSLTAAREYAAIPLFQQALAYSQAAIFTCESSRSLSWCSAAQASQFSNWVQGGGGRSGATTLRTQRVQRPDVSTLSLNSTRLIAAREWTCATEGERICPREVREVVDCGMEEVRDRIEEALQVCRWNDLLEGVFLRGERSEEVLESLDKCFDELEGNAGTIQMQHLLRSNLFKTVQNISRLGPISLIGHASPSNAHGPGEVWRSRAGALAFRWTGRVIEWTGL